MDVKLSPEAMRIIEARIASGEFRDATAVVEAALRKLAERSRAEEGLDEDWLRSAYEDGLAEADPRDDIPFDAEAILRSVRASSRIRS